MNDMRTAPEQGTVRLERLLPGPIERVWAYLTESDKRATWFAGGTFELRVDGRADLHFDHSNISSEKSPPDEHKNMKSDWVCRITRLEPLRLLSYTFDPAGPESEERYAALRKLLSTLPRPGTDLAIVSHGNPFNAVAGAPYLAEGEAAVIRPLGPQGFAVIARVPKNAWDTLSRE